jgi:hypothetical protein
MIGPQSKKRGRTRWVILLVAVLIPTALYLGSYYALARRQLFGVGDFTGKFSYRLTPRLFYRHESDATDALFRPAHELDRLLRPAYWGPQEYPSTEDVPMEVRALNRVRHPPLVEP